MPELPEVETIRRQLAPAVEGRRIERMEILDPRWCEPAPPEEVGQAVEHRRVERLERRGKWLIWELADEVHLIMHLRMTGNLLLAPRGDSDRRYLRVRIDLDDGNHVLFCDARRFGTGSVLLGAGTVAEWFTGRVGIEPLGPDFTAEALRAMATGRRAPVKAFLLSQERVAGVGNIYADEALWRAKVHPLRRVGTLKRPQFEALRDAVVEVLHAGIDAKGATIDDYRDAAGAEGSFQDRFEVYGRAGEACSRCGATIQKIRAAGRGTYFCPTCQRRPRSGS
ncbi:MAG: bifunctional DNA-formamidopyrimidine glycosylase/DNA-(apurinic or apyrimidinic site) lyase [Thermoleophilaceae bacterium]